MKKFVMGLIVGIFVMAGGSVFADSVVKNMIGEKVDGQFPVSLSGSDLDTPAIVVDGTSFLPVRQFGEAAGYDVTFDPEGKIKLDKKAVSAVDSSTYDPSAVAKEEEQQMQQKVSDQNDLQEKIGHIENQISKDNELIKYAQEKLDKEQKLDDKFVSDWNAGNIPHEDDQTLETTSYHVQLQQSITDDQAKIDSLNAEISDLQSQLDDLQSQLDALN